MRPWSRHSFRPVPAQEFPHRIDKLIRFRAFGGGSTAHRAAQLAELAPVCRTAAWSCKWKSGVDRGSAAQGYEPEYGARPCDGCCAPRSRTRWPPELLEDHFPGGLGVRVTALAPESRAAILLLFEALREDEGEHPVGESLPGCCQTARQAINPGIPQPLPHP